MDPFDVAFLKGTIAFGVAAATIFGGVRLWLRARHQSNARMDRQMAVDREENAQFQADLRARVTELEERLDFTERLLTKQRQQEQLPSARIPTPV